MSEHANTGSSSSCSTQSSSVSPLSDVRAEKGKYTCNGQQGKSACARAEVVRPKSTPMDSMSSLNSGSRNSISGDFAPSFVATLNARRSLEDGDSRLPSDLEDVWKVRQALAALVPPQNANTYFMELVKNGKSRELGVFFRMGRSDPSIHIGSSRLKDIINYTDEHERSALRVAIDNRDAEMCRILLDFDITIDDCLYHAIRKNFVEGAEAILRRDNCRRSHIRGENYYFPVGITPVMYAAHCNNYDMLKLLYKYRHKLEKDTSAEEDLRMTWETSNKRRMLCRAQSSPAYITLWTELNSQHDPIKYCMDRIEDIRQRSELEQEYSETYEQLEADVENYMCALLDQVRSSEELAHLFKYDYDRSSDKKSGMAYLREAARKRSDTGVMLELLDTASQKGLVKFVTHFNSQLALTYLRYRHMYFVREMNFVKRFLLGAITGLMFPFLSICYLISPDSSLGGLLCLPIVSFLCHAASDVMFIAILLANVLSKTLDQDYLGAPPTTFEWLLLLWVLGKWRQEAQECMNRGLKNYVCDWWNYNDVLQLSIFSVCFGLRICDYIRYNSAPTQVRRSQWGQYEPRLLSEALISWAYVFAFLRVFSLVRANKVLGPLQVSLSRMINDIVLFFCIFILVIMSFALGLSELYWFYGTDPGWKLICGGSAASNATASCKKPPVLFTNLGNSLSSLFYAIYGIIDVDKVLLSGKHTVIETAGRSLVAVYHVVAIVVLVNMFIAMMAKSFDEISSNGATVWKFHRTAMWIRFIRREIGGPPPMNLIPHVRRHVSKIASMCRRVMPLHYQDQHAGSGEPSRVKRPSEPGDFLVEGKGVLRWLTVHDRKSLEVMRRLVQRYKHAALLGRVGKPQCEWNDLR